MTTVDRDQIEAQRASRDFEVMLARLVVCLEHNRDPKDLLEKARDLIKRKGSFSPLREEYTEGDERTIL